MIKMIITGAVVSKGANDGPAVKFSGKGDFVRFRIGYKIYDTRAENNHRWINLTVKAFGDLCDRINKMDLKAGSYISLSGRYDEDVWEDEKTKAKKSMPVIILDEVEFCFSGSSKKTDGNQKATSEPQCPAQTYAAPSAGQYAPQGYGTPPAGFAPQGYGAQPAGNEMPGNFIGFQSYGNGGSFI